MITYTHPKKLSKWDRRFIEMANHIAAWSKGPRTRVGAVIVRPDRSIASLGYNGPPRGFDDEAFLDMPREEQHKFVIHAEINAIRQAHRDEDLSNYTLYVSPMLPCKDCARAVVSTGIRRVVAYCGHMSQDWIESAKEANRIFANNAVEFLFTME